MNQRGIGLTVHMGVGALSVILVFGLSHLFISHNDQARTNYLQISGVTTFSASELVEIVRREKILVYWVGPLPRMKYALIANEKSGATLIYIPRGAQLGAASTDRLTVHTHGESHITTPLRSVDKESGYKSQSHPFQENSFDLILTGKGLIVTIHDPAPDGALNYAKKAGAIKRIS